MDSESPAMSESDMAKLEAMLAKYEGGGAAPEQGTTATAPSPASRLLSQETAALQAEKKAAEERARLAAEQKVLVSKVLAEKGESGISEMLRSEIAKTKKIESDIAAAKKKAEQALRENDALAAELSKLLQQKTAVEAQVTQLLSETQHLSKELGNRKTHDAAQRDQIKAKIKGELANLRAKLEAEDVEYQKTMAENLVLREEFAVAKGQFDETFAKYESDWKLRETQMRLLVTKAQEQIKLTEKLEAQFLLNHRELAQLQEQTASLTGQRDMFASKMSDFDEGVVRTGDVANIAQRQRAQLQAKLDEQEKERAELVEAKRLYDLEASKVRTKIQQLKNRVKQAEKAKTVAESKCREAQAAMAKEKAKSQKDGDADKGKENVE